jgi:hypothetical protein
MKYTILFLTLFLFSTNGQALNSYYLEQDDIGTDAYSISIGNIGGFENTASAIFSNPAAIPSTVSFSSFQVETIADEVLYQANSAAWFVKGVGTFGIGISGTEVDGLHRTGLDEFGEFVSVGSFEHKRSVTKLAYQFKLNQKTNIGFGLSSYENVIGSVRGTGMDGDIGLKTSMAPFELSLVGKNILFQNVSYTNGVEERLPTILTGALKASLTNIELFFQASAYDFPSSTLLQSYGLSYRPFNLSFLSLTVGSREFVAGNETRSTISFGSRLLLDPLYLNYAYSPNDYQDQNHYFSLALNF